MGSPQGKPDGWSQRLWDAYQDEGQADVGYVQACNRFLGAMIRYRLHETLELVRNLMLHFVCEGEVSNPERYLSGPPSLLVWDVIEAKDERDIYRVWWEKHIRWEKVKECLCDRKPIELDLLHGLLSPKVGQRQQIWRTHPMFLSACVQVARRSLHEDGFPHLEAYTSQGKHDLTQPTPKGEELWITASARMEEYLTSGEWRIDDHPLEDLKDFGEAFDVKRGLNEDRKTYISRVLELLDDRLIRAMYKATEISLQPKVPTRGRPPDPTLKMEEMLVLRMFGEEPSSIAKTMKSALVGVKHPPNTVHTRTTAIASRLGFLPPLAKKRKK